LRTTGVRGRDAVAARRNLTPNALSEVEWSEERGTRDGVLKPTSYLVPTHYDQTRPYSRPRPRLCPHGLCASDAEGGEAGVAPLGHDRASGDAVRSTCRRGTG